MTSRLAARLRAAFEASPSPNPEETTMRRRFTDPADRRIANRWMAINLAVYGTLALATIMVAQLTFSSVKEQVVRAPANATAIQRTVAR
jgi:hypothetical protein